MRIINILQIEEEQKYLVNGKEFFGGQILNWSVRDVKQLIYDHKIKRI